MERRIEEELKYSNSDKRMGTGEVTIWSTRNKDDSNYELHDQMNLSCMISEVKSEADFSNL